MGVLFGSLAPAVIPSAYGTDGFATINEKDTHEYKDEMAYYDKLEEVKDKYDVKVKSYTHAIIIYLYYFIKS